MNCKEKSCCDAPLRALQRYDRYHSLARMHRQAVALAATLATRLRLTPHSKLDKLTPTDGELPVA